MDMVIKILADFTMIPLLIIAGYALLLKVPKRQRYDRYTHVVMAGLTSYYLAKIIALFWQPTGLRPFEELGVQPGASYLGNPGFPSDHVLFAMFLTLAVWYATRKSFPTILLLLITFAMALGRVLALVHTVPDVIGGMVIAGVGAVWYIANTKKLPERRLAKKTNN